MDVLRTNLSINNQILGRFDVFASSITIPNEDLQAQRDIDNIQTLEQINNASGVTLISNNKKSHGNKKINRLLIDYTNYDNVQ
jgi:hypothetical protein